MTHNEGPFASGGAFVWVNNHEAKALLMHGKPFIFVLNGKLMIKKFANDLDIVFDATPITVMSFIKAQQQRLFGKKDR